MSDAATPFWTAKSRLAFAKEKMRLKAPVSEWGLTLWLDNRARLDNRATDSVTHETKPRKLRFRRRRIEFVRGASVWTPERNQEEFELRRGIWL